MGAGILLALFSGILIWWLVNQTVGKPVREITNVYQEIGMGNFAARTKVKAKDELGTMAFSLNAMLEQIQKLNNIDKPEIYFQRVLNRLKIY